MNGQTILNSFLKNNDPIIFLKELLEIHHKYLKKTNPFIDRLRQWWIEKFTYPYFRYKVYKTQIDTANMIYTTPSVLTQVILRYLKYALSYARLIKIDLEDLLEKIFPQDFVTLNTRMGITIEGPTIEFLSITIRSFLVDQDNDDPKKDKFVITNIEIDMENMSLNIGQTVYDTDNAEFYKTANIIYSKQFNLSVDGELTNPNYILDKSLLENDMEKYRLMISQLLIFLGGLFDETCKLQFYQVKPK